MGRSFAWALNRPTPLCAPASDRHEPLADITTFRYIPAHALLRNVVNEPGRARMARMRGRDLRLLRMRAGLSQNELAQALGVHKSLISITELEQLGEFAAPEFADRYVAACSAKVATS